MSDEHRYDYAADRLKSATVALLTDQSDEGQMYLHLLIDNQLYGDELMYAIEQAEEYLKKKGEL